MTSAAVSSSGATSRGPRLSYFWWLKRNEESGPTATADGEAARYTPFEADDIPSSTGNLWKDARPRAW